MGGSAQKCIGECKIHFIGTLGRRIWQPILNLQSSSMVCVDYATDGDEFFTTDVGFQFVIGIGYIVVAL